MPDIAPYCDDCAPIPKSARLTCNVGCQCECHWCGLCGLDRTRRLNHLCNACNAYTSAMGQPPSPRVIRRRINRRELDRLEHEAWGAA